MTRPARLTYRAGASLALSQLLLGVAAAGDGGIALVVAGLGALGALVLAALWFSRGEQRLLYGTAAAGSLGLFAPIHQPLGVLERGLALAAVLSLLAFLEYGQLSHRVARVDVGEDEGTVEAAMRSRLFRALAWTALATTAVVVLTAVPGPWFGETFQVSVERGGPLGVLLVGGAVATSTVAVARLRVELARSDDADAE